MHPNPEDRAVATLRSLTSDDLAADLPPPDLFDAIAAEAFVDGGAAASDQPSVESPSPHAGVVDLAEHRARRARTLTIVGAVAAGVLLLAGVAGGLTNREPGTEFVASADLELLAGGGSGRAELVERNNSLFLVLDVSDLAAAEQADFYELWLLAPDVSDMASLAKFDRSTDTIEVELPEGVDPNALPVVDISEELDDGDDTHSGLSILRGTLA
ncbi:MAG: anti-sigma factor [Microthrixaceae bacterium]